MHSLSDALLAIVDEEASSLLNAVDRGGELRWEAFVQAWFRIVRRVVFGDAARNDERITELMLALRSDADWAFLKPKRTHLRDELHRRIGAISTALSLAASSRPSPAMGRT